MAGMDPNSMLPQEPWNAGKARSGPVSQTQDRPKSDISTPSGGSTVSRMLSKPMGNKDMTGTQAIPLPGSTAPKENSWFDQGPVKTAGF